MAKEKKKLEIKVDDRVAKLNSKGCLGTVKVLREEVVGSSGEASQHDYLIKVQWDNGTLSYMAPESLTVIE